MDIESVVSQVKNLSLEGVVIMEFDSVGSDSRIVWVNDALCRMTGYAREELVGQPSGILRAPVTDIEKVKERRRAADEGRVTTGEWLTRRKDGTTFWTDMRAVPIRDDEGRLRYIIGYRNDQDGLVAARMRLEAEAEELRRERARLAAELVQLERLTLAARFISDGVMILDSAFRITWANEAFLRRNGRKLEDIVGRRSSDILRGPSNDPERSAAVDARLAQGLGARVENRFLRGDGSEYWVELVIEPVRDAAGRVGQFIVVSRDISERKATEAALETERARAVAAEERLRGAVDAVPEGFVLYDAEDRFVTCNERFRALYAESAASLVPGTPFIDILRCGLANGQYPDAVGNEEAWLAARLAAHRACGEPTEIELAGGRRVRIWERRSALGDTVGFRIDVTDLRDAQARAEAAEQRLRAAIETIPDAILICDPEDRIVLANEAYRTLYDDEGVDLTPGMTFADLMVRLDAVRGVGPEDGLARESIESRQRRLAGEEEPSDLHIRHRGRWFRRIDRRTPAGDAVSVRIDITEFRESQVRAEAAEGRLRAAIETIPDAILICDPDDRIVLANEGYRRIYREDGLDLRPGMTFTELMSAFDRVHGFEPGTGPGAEALASRQRRLSGEAAPGDFKVPGRDQWFRRIDRRTPEGGVVSVRIDVTEFRKALTRAEAAEGRLLTAIEALPDGFVIYDAEDRFVLCNSTYRTYFAEAASQLVPGTPFRTVVEAIVASGKIAEAIGCEEAWVEARMERHRNPVEASEEGHASGLWLKVVDRRTPDGGTVGLRIDITDLKRQQARAEAAEQRLRNAIEALPHAFALFDAEDRLVLCNAPFRSLHGEIEDDVREGVTFEALVRAAVARGAHAGRTGGDEDWIATRMEMHRQGCSDAEIALSGGRWMRVIEQKTPDGGTVGLRIDVTAMKAEQARAEAAEQRLMAAIEALPDGFVLFDPEDRFVLCNSTYRNIYAGAAELLVPGRSFEDILRHLAGLGGIPEAVGRVEEWIAERMASHRAARGTVDLRRRGDRWFKTIERRMPDGGIVGLRIDVSDLKAEQARAEAAERYLREAIEALPDGFVIYDAEDRFVLCNRTFRGLYPGTDRALTPGTPFRDLAEAILRTGNVPVEPGHEAEWLAFRLEHFRNPTEDYEQRLSSNRWLKVIDRRMADGGMVGLRIDVSDLKEQQARLERYAALLSRANARISEKHAELVRSQETAEHRARHDALTGLPNRRFLDEVLQGIALGEGAPTIAVLHIDLDRFKEINDTLGHAAGDAVLTAVADRLRETVRTSDFVARVGGDEFVVVCRHAAGRQDLATLSERILERLRQPVDFESHQCRFGGSIGIAQSGEGIADARALLVRADLALYRAKNTGRNRFEFFDASLMENLNRRKQVADGIAQGIDAGEFRPHYQPQFDLRRYAIAGVEALARWERPDGSVLLPGRFLDVATDLGLDAEIDRVILERVACDLAAWDRDGIAVPHGSVNVSARRLREPALIESLRALGLPRGRIVFELLESIFLDQPEGIVAFNLDSLRELGITVELDDFGTGYASLVGLVRLRPSAIKIDQQLVRPATRSATELKVVEALINIGHAIGVRVIAEGTETAEQVALLASLGCDAAQGDYFAPALPEPAFRRFHAAATARLVRDGPAAIREFRRIADDALKDWEGRRAAS